MNEEYKCKDCKWLTGQKNIRGIECMNPVLQKKWNGAKNLWMGELRKDTARYKQRNAPACKKFEAKESKPMSRHIDADALITDLNKGLWGKDWDKVLAEAIINDAPSIDIVRCQDCKYWVYNFNGCSRNPCTEPWYATDFCNYGERSRR